MFSRRKRRDLRFLEDWYFVFLKKYRLIKSQKIFRSRYIVFIRSLCRVVAALGIHQPKRIAKLIGTLYEFQKKYIQSFFNYVLLHWDYTGIMLSVQIPKIARKTTTKHGHFWRRLNLGILENVPNHRGVKKLIFQKCRFATFTEDLCFTCCPL